MMKILVFGTGGIGSVYVYVLHKAGADVTTVCRSNYDAIKEQGITINSKIFGDVHVKPKAVQHISNAEGPWDFIVICSKAMPGSSPSTAGLIQLAVGSSTAIVLIQNGIDIESEYAHAFPQNTIISGVVYLPATQVKPGIISMGNLELLELGTFPHDASNVSKDKVEQFAQSIRAGGATARVYSDIQARRWSKLVLNASWNPICALSLLSDKNFLRLSPEAVGLVRTVMLEVVSVAQTLGYREVNTETVDNQLNRVKARVEPDGVEPSMLTDVRSNRPLEVEAILGNTVRIARKKGINTPMLEMLYILAKGLSQSITMSQSA